MCLNILVTHNHGMKMVVLCKCKETEDDLLRSCNLTSILKTDQFAIAALHEAKIFTTE